VNVAFAVACDYAIIDQHGKLSVLGMFERIWVQSFPVVHPRLHLVLRLKGRRTEIGDHPVQIRLVDDLGHEVLRGDGAVQIGEPPAGILEVEAGAVLAFDIPLEHAGTYTFEIAVDGSLEATVPLMVSQIPAPAAPAPPPGDAN
jgi:hypothetical protein